MLNNSRYKTGWYVQGRVQLKMHEKDRSLVLKIQEYFGGIGLVSNPIIILQWNLGFMLLRI
jgi:hypothetical protein